LAGLGCGSAELDVLSLADDQRQPPAPGAYSAGISKPVSTTPATAFDKVPKAIFQRRLLPPGDGGIRWQISDRMVKGPTAALGDQALDLLLLL
jgi:hypothetical protein